MPPEDTHAAVYIAMWSGPRNISTALMRSFGNRPDTFVCDEPFYGHYLAETGLQHPGREEIIASMEADWRKVANYLTGPVPEGKTIFYQKHMAHHLLPHISRDWTTLVTNVFLIRDPREMLTSLMKVTPNITVEDTGMLQQRELFDRMMDEGGTAPPVIDAKDVLADPKALLSRLCRAVGIEFTEKMLRWRSGLRESDGVWAKYWYGQVKRSNGFLAYKSKDEPVPAYLQTIYEECLEHYNRLYEHRLRA